LLRQAPQGQGCGENSDSPSDVQTDFGRPQPTAQVLAAQKADHHRTNELDNGSADSRCDNPHLPGIGIDVRCLSGAKAAVP